MIKKLLNKIFHYDHEHANAVCLEKGWDEPPIKNSMDPYCGCGGEGHDGPCYGPKRAGYQ